MGQEPLISYSSARAKYLNLTVSAALWPLERWLEWRARHDPAPVCFIVGPPRSGTTLLYELVVTRFRCGYFSNLAKRLFRVPVAATWLCRREIAARSGSFDSVYGELQGKAAPSEAGRVWIHWTPYAAPYHREEPGIPPQRIRRKMAAIGRVAGRPVVVKNPILQTDLGHLTGLFPDALFLHIERDWADNARSLMKLRDVRAPGDATGWVSLRPPGWESYAGADALTQSCAQVMLSQQDIARHLAGEETRGRVKKIAYDRLCAEPEAVLEEIEAFFRENGVAAERKPNAAPPAAIAPRGQPEDETRERILACLAGLSGQAAP